MFPSIYTKLLCEQEILWVPGKSSRSSSSSKDSSWVGKWPCLILRNPRQGDWQIGIKMANPPGGVENFYVMKSRGQNGWSPKLYIKAEGLFREYDKDHSKTTVLELPTMTFHHDRGDQIRADCYILLRQAVKNKKAPFLNIQNEDKKWFKSVLCLIFSKCMKVADF